MERTEIMPSFLLSSFLLACTLKKSRSTAHHDGKQNGARIKSISRTVSALCRQEKSLLHLILLTSASKKNSSNKKGSVGFVGSAW